MNSLYNLGRDPESISELDFRRKFTIAWNWRLKNKYDENRSCWKYHLNVQCIIPVSLKVAVLRDIIAYIAEINDSDDVPMIFCIAFIFLILRNTTFVSRERRLCHCVTLEQPAYVVCISVSLAFPYMVFISLGFPYMVMLYTFKRIHHCSGCGVAMGCYGRPIVPGAAILMSQCYGRYCSMEYARIWAGHLSRPWQREFTAITSCQSIDNLLDFSTICCIFLLNSSIYIIRRNVGWGQFLWYSIDARPKALGHLLSSPCSPSSSPNAPRPWPVKDPCSVPPHS